MIPLRNIAIGEQPLSSTAYAEYPFCNRKAARLTTFDGFGKELILWKKLPNGNMAVPRAICPRTQTNTRSFGLPVKWECTAKPRNEEQKRGVKETVEFLKQGKSGILVAPTGSGKTVMCLMISAIIAKTTLVVMHKEDLIHQWEERILEHTNIPADKIGRVKQDICEYEGKSIVLASLQSLIIEDKYPEAFWRYFGLTIYDEVHRTSADEWSKVFHKDCADLRLGATATPRRSDKKDIVARSHIGPVRVELENLQMKPKVFIIKSPWICPKQKTDSGKYVVIPHEPPKTGMVEKFLRRNKERNEIIRDALVKFYNGNRKAVCFSSTIEHLETLQELIELEGVPTKEIGLYYGSRKKEELASATLCSIIFATLGKMGEGTDIPELDAAILTTPLANIAQPVGRILRKFSGKAQPILIDIQDLDSPVFSAYSRKRLKWYSEIGAECINLSSGS